MNVLIFGFGLHGGGYSDAMYFLRKGCRVRITDLRKEDALNGSAGYLRSLGIEIIAGRLRKEDFRWADLVVKTTSADPDSELLFYAKKVVCSFSCLFDSPAAGKVKIIAITGTKGKTVTASAICHALNRLGKTARMCGNMGTSPFSELEKWENGNVPDCLVCELSTWQVRDICLYCTDLPSFELAIITNYYPDDLSENFFGHSSGYSAAEGGKGLLFGKNTKALICPFEYKTVFSQLKGNRPRTISSVEYYASRISKSLPNNMAPAFAALRKLGFSVKEINEALQGFRGVPHRAEIVSTADNVMVINDSAATIPEALSFTMSNYKDLPVHLICGGTDSSLNPEPMLYSLKRCASLHLLDGSFTREKLLPMLTAQGLRFSGPFDTMEDAVDSAMSCIKPQSKLQVLLLSPGAYAYELFDNEYTRGDRFKECFLRLLP